jgi:molybdenum cofactor cytidylyltransferase
MHITGVILAAGSSSRMGSENQLLLKYKNHTVIEEVLINLQNSNVDDIIIVTEYQEGRAESVKCALKNLSDNSSAALFMVGDKPGVNSTLINKALDTFNNNEPDLLYVQTQSGRGHPIIFSNKIYDELMKLKGDIVGDEIIEKYKENSISLYDRIPQIDIDTHDDYLIMLDENNS